jgi:hypothetical protein
MKTINLDLKLSIITVNKNNYDGLINTLNSLKDNVNSDSYQHIIVDGNSNDLLESFDTLKKKYSFDFISENDSGIYNAMNKGIGLASFKRLLFLNSGDSIINDINFDKFISLNLDYDLVYSNLLKVNREGLVTESNFPNILSLDYMICFGLPHQATIIKKSLFEKISFYDEKYKIISDWVFFMEALFFNKATYIHIDLSVVNFDISGISNQNIFVKTIIVEQLDYINKRFPEKVSLYKSKSPYVKKYFRSMPRWKRLILRFLFIKFNLI